MTTEEKIHAITELVENYKNLHKAFDNRYKALGFAVGPLHDAAFKTFDLLTKHVAIRCDDTFHRIEWFIYENECGKKDLTVIKCRGHEPQKLKTVKELVEIMEYKEEKK